MYKHLWYLQSRSLCVSKSDGHGVPNANLFNFTFLLVDFGKVLCSSANLKCFFQRRLYATNIDLRTSNASSREHYIPQIQTVLLEIHFVYI